MILLVLDPAHSTGYCLVRIDDTSKATEIYKDGFIDVDIISDYQGDHCINLMQRIQTIITDHTVSHIGVEDFYFSKRKATGSTVNMAYRTAIHILARQNNINYTIINITAWKTFIAGRSTPTKPQKSMYGAINAKKIMIQQVLWEKYNIKFPNHSISQKTGKPIQFRFDIVDVTAQAIYWCCIVHNVHLDKITYTVPVIPDIPVKKKNKKEFIYLAH